MPVAVDRVRRCTILLVQRCERNEFSLEDVLSGGAGVVRESQWLVLAPHLRQEVPVTIDDLRVLEAVSPDAPSDVGELAETFGGDRIRRLVDVGLLLPALPSTPEADRDRQIRDVGWWPLAAAAQVFGRWSGVDVSDETLGHRGRSLNRMVVEDGLPPVEAASVTDPEHWQRLPMPEKRALDALMGARTTCRNFDLQAMLSASELATMLHRTFAAQASETLLPGVVALKKNCPSGGGLHPIEAYLLVRRVDGVAAGIYHYHSVEHVLEPMRPLSEAEAAAAAHDLVAGQSWFADAPVLVLMAARYGRSYWKYRNHTKAWRVIQLDAGHLSQNIYLSATEMGLGAFVTGAINDECAERLFDLDGFQVGPVVVCGFGRRAETIVTTEFDPLGKAVR